MNLLPVLHILAFVIDLWAIIFILNRKPVTRANFLASLLLSSFAIWSLAYTLIHLSTSPEQVIIWIDISSIGWTLFPVLGLWFFLDIVGHNKLLQNKFFVIFSLSIGLFFLIMQWNGQMVTDVALKPYGWVGLWNISNFSILYFVFSSGVSICGVLLCVHWRRRTASSRLKRQSALLIYTTTASLILGNVTDVILPIAGIFIIPQIADIMTLFWLSGIVVSITKFGMLGVTLSTAAEKIIDTMHDPLLIVDPQRKIVLFNKAMSDMSPLTNLAGRDVLDMVEDKENAAVILDSAFNGSLEGEREFLLLAENGRIVPCIVSTSAIKDKLGDILGVVLVCKDISLRKQTDLELMGQKKLIDDIIANIPDAIVLTTADLEVIKANRSFYELADGTSPGNDGLHLNSMIQCNELLDFIADFMNCNKKKDSCQYKCGAGEQLRTFLTDVVRMDAGQMMLVIKDITEEQNHRERMYLSERLASVGEMASGIAHELNNPLTSIISLSQMVLAEHGQGEAGEDINLISQEAKRAAAIVRNMLSFARKHHAAKTELQVNQVIDDILALRRYEHKVNNINVREIFADDLPFIIADYYQLQQVFLNIILNAENAMEAQSTPREITISTEKQADFVKIIIKDSGPGIPAENLGKIFNPFFTTKEVGKGTGLGLSICYGIVAAHKGRIYAENNGASGAIITIELPSEYSPEDHISAGDGEKNSQVLSYSG